MSFKTYLKRSGCLQNFNCLFCTFNKKDGIPLRTCTIHAKQHEQPKRECQRCGKKFVWNISLKKHKNSNRCHRKPIQNVDQNHTDNADTSDCEITKHYRKKTTNKSPRNPLVMSNLVPKTSPRKAKNAAPIFSTSGLHPRLKIMRKLTASGEQIFTFCRNDLPSQSGSLDLTASEETLPLSAGDIQNLHAVTSMACDSGTFPYQSQDTVEPQSNDVISCTGIDNIYNNHQDEVRIINIEPRADIEELGDCDENLPTFIYGNSTTNCDGEPYDHHMDTNVESRMPMNPPLVVQPTSPHIVESTFSPRPSSEISTNSLTDYLLNANGTFSPVRSSRSNSVSPDLNTKEQNTSHGRKRNNSTNCFDSSLNLPSVEQFDKNAIKNVISLQRNVWEEFGEQADTLTYHTSSKINNQVSGGDVDCKIIHQNGISKNFKNRTAKTNCTKSAKPGKKPKRTYIKSGKYSMKNRFASSVSRPTQPCKTFTQAEMAPGKYRRKPPPMYDAKLLQSISKTSYNNLLTMLQSFSKSKKRKPISADKTPLYCVHCTKRFSVKVPKQYCQHKYEVRVMLKDVLRALIPVE